MKDELEPFIAQLRAFTSHLREQGEDAAARTWDEAVDEHERTGRRLLEILSTIEAKDEP